MRVTGSAYRQRVADFRRRLSQFAAGNVPQGDRILIDGSGHGTRNVPSNSEIERFTIYGRRRLHSIARVMALFEIMRDHEKLSGKPIDVKDVEARGAYWQAFQGTSTRPACHTCPALLFLNGQLPIHMTMNQGLRRHIIVEFADCMIMPAMINKIDRLIDDNAGWFAFERAGSAVLISPKTTWRDAVNVYIEGMRDLFPEMITIIESGSYIVDPEVGKEFKAVQAFYEGLFLTPINGREMDNFMTEVRTEMSVP